MVKRADRSKIGETPRKMRGTDRKIERASSSKDAPSSRRANSPQEILFLIRRKVGVILTLAVALGVVGLAVKQIVSKPPTKPSFAHAGRVKSINPLFQPVVPRVGIDRKSLPKELESALKDLAELQPVAEFDPDRPNLYIIPQMHFVGQVSRDQAKAIFELQGRILRIQHVLYSLGMRKQFLEGVPVGVELKHNVVNPNLGEDPVRAMPNYLSTGKVRRAYVAVEGIYGDGIVSLGLEGNFAETLKLDQEYNRADAAVFPKAREQILEAVGKGLDIDMPSDQQTGAISYDRLKIEIQKRVSKLSAEVIQSLVEKYVFSNPYYLDFLQAATKRFYNRIQGRDEQYVKGISAYTDGQDASFAVGAEHCTHLVSLLGAKYNVFVIFPKGLDKAEINPFFSQFTEEDYRKSIIEHDLEIFGLGPKPKHSLW